MMSLNKYENVAYGIQTGHSTTRDGYSRNNDTVLTAIILDYATRLYREKEFTRAEYLVYVSIFTKREKILSNSIYSAMDETVLALDIEAASARGSSSKFTLELCQPLSLDKTSIINWRRSPAMSGTRGIILRRTTIGSDTTTVRSGTKFRYPGCSQNHRLQLRNQTVTKKER